LVADDDFEVILGRGETRTVEYKSAGSANDGQLLAQVTKAILAMSNLRDGGLVVIGVSEGASNVLVRTGVTTVDLSTWKARDTIRDRVAVYADPSVAFRVEERQHRDGCTYVLIEVDEFDISPVICRKAYGSVLAEGAIYVRSRRKPESVPVRTAADMRDVMELAVEKELARVLRTAARAGGKVVSATPDSDRFDDELRGLS
jgi:predicted HTH transcriptional regulator